MVKSTRKTHKEGQQNGTGRELGIKKETGDIKINKIYQTGRCCGDPKLVKMLAIASVPDPTIPPVKFVIFTRQL